MFTNKKNNAKMAWDYGRDPVCEAVWIPMENNYNFSDSILIAFHNLPVYLICIKQTKKSHFMEIYLYCDIDSNIGIII